MECARHSVECCLTESHLTALLLTLLTLLLLLQKLFLSGNITSADHLSRLDENIFAVCSDSFAGNELSFCPSLNDNDKLLPWEDFLKLLANNSCFCLGIVLVADKRKRRYDVAIQMDINF